MTVNERALVQPAPKSGGSPAASPRRPGGGAAGSLPESLASVQPSAPRPGCESAAAGWALRRESGGGTPRGSRGPSSPPRRGTAQTPTPSRSAGPAPLLSAACHPVPQPARPPRLLRWLGPAPFFSPAALAGSLSSLFPHHPQPLPPRTPVWRGIERRAHR